MPAVNSNQLNTVPAEVYYTPYVASVPTLATDGSNANAVKAYLAGLSYTRLASVIDLNITVEQSADMVEVITDDNQTIYKSSRPATGCTFTWYESSNLPAVAGLIGETVVSVAGTLTNVLGENKGSATAWNAKTPFKLNFKDGDNTIVAAIVLKQGATYGAATTITGTDYQTYVGDGINGELGYTYVVPLVAGKANTIWADYDYTPNASQLISQRVQNKEIPRVIVKIVTLPDDAGKVNTHFLYDACIDGTLTMPFQDIARAGDLPGSEVGFMVNKGGYYISNLERL